MKLRHIFGAGTHVGNKRDNNEDSYACDPENELWIVADGMGGLGFGEVASAISTYTILTNVRDGRGVNQSIELAHKRIQEFAARDGMGANAGTTIVLLLSQGNRYNVFWAGDSRAYLFDGSLSQLTVDHSIVQSLVEQGELTAKEAESDPRKNAVTKALGVKELGTVRADSVSNRWRAEQKVLLCSDGLSDCVRQHEIEAILQEQDTDQEKVDKLIDAAVTAGGKDNITVILISAPDELEGSDDTDVPEVKNRAKEDTTEVNPDSDTDATRMRPLSFDILGQTDEASVSRPQQLELPEAMDNSRIKIPKPDLWLDWQKWLLAATTVVTVILFARLTTAEKKTVTPFTTAGLVQLQTTSNIPMALNDLPTINLAQPGTVIQLGIFSRLQGAESRQFDLGKIGLIPQIEKKIIDDSIMYAVLLGPFRDATRHAETIALLEAQKFQYFSRPAFHY